MVFTMSSSMSFMSCMMSKRVVPFDVKRLLDAKSNDEGSNSNWESAEQRAEKKFAVSGQIFGVSPGFISKT